MKRDAWLIALTLSGFASGHAAPITFNTALPIGAGDALVRQQLIYRKADHGASDIDELTSMTLAGYGLTPDLSLFALMPLTYRRLDAEQDRLRFGDLQVFGRYTAYQYNFPGGTLRVSPFAGVELPTGEHGGASLLTDGGSGSWDPLAGVVVSLARLDLNLDLQLYWQGNTRADGRELGDEFRADVSIQPRIYPDRIDTDTHGFLFGALEFNFAYQRETRLNGTADPDSGGTRLFVTPGLHYAARRWMAEAAIKVPVLQNLNGAEVRDDFVVFTGFRWNF